MIGADLSGGISIIEAPVSVLSQFLCQYNTPGLFWYGWRLTLYSVSRSQSLFKLLFNTFDKQNAELAYQFMMLDFVLSQKNEVKCLIIPIFPIQSNPNI